MTPRLVSLLVIAPALLGPLTAGDAPRPDTATTTPAATQPAIQPATPTTSRAAAPATVPAAQGSIEGVIRVRPVRQRRAAARYPGGGMASRPIQEIPALVYLRGQAGPAPAPADDAVMAQRDTMFEPTLLVVPAGTSVRFPNHDPFFHNVFSYSGAARFDLGRYPRGESKDVLLPEPGVVKVYCEVHESMRSAIIVVENPHWSRVDDEGRFRIEGVPAGRHTLVAWHADRGEKEVAVVVTAGGVARVELEL